MGLSVLRENGQTNFKTCFEVSVVIDKVRQNASMKPGNRKKMPKKASPQKDNA